MAGVVETTHLTARVPARLVDDLAKIAAADDRSVSYVVRQALREFVEDREDLLSDSPDPEGAAA